jgi:hypothetical protein
MSETSMLISCTGKITRAELANLPTAPSTATHIPIPHAAVVETLVETLSHRHIGVVDEEFAVSSDAMEMFGVLDLETSFEGCRCAIVSPRIRKRGFLITRRFESEPSASSPKRSGGLSSRRWWTSCFAHDAATRVNPSSASALIAIADSVTAAIFAGSRRGRSNDALLTGATRRQRLVEKPTNYVSAPIGVADAGLA